MKRQRILGLLVLAGAIAASAAGQTFEVVHSFDGAHGQTPIGGLAKGNDGLMYGTTQYGGANGKGTIYRRNAGGTLTILHDFDGTKGAYPLAPLLQASDGNFYGTASGGGDHNLGTIFRMTPNGDVELLYSFDGGANGRYPTTALIEASDGKFYGTARHGANANCEGGCGTVFRIDDAGFLVTLHSFDGTDGANPHGGLVETDDHAIWGTSYGYSDANGHNEGTVFRLPFTGGFETMHSFGGPDGVHPAGTLLLASDGKLYGTAYGGMGTGSHPTGGPPVGGGIFRMTVDGQFSVFAPFDPAHLLLPQAGLIEGTDGNLYGTTTQGGASGWGTVYRATFGGDVTVLHEFEPPDGRIPWAPLAMAGNGDLYGVAQFGGANDFGTIFRLAFGSGPLYCPNAFVRRDQMAVFLLKTEHGAAHVPPSCAGVFPDVACPGLIADWIEELADEGITGGCGGGNYCPLSPVTRGQMAVFLLKTEHGPTHTPPSCVGVFTDVPCGSQFADWIEELASEGITGGCGGSNYCPTNPVTRAQMAVFLLKIEHGSAFAPPPCSPLFADVVCPSLFADWIEQLYAEHITAGCAGPP